ncbi:GLE1-domain-containing protein [Lojkania enalia]|uniref:mRNA export factor GLE1 n=1 Tax=Lojkania enalia TaxID=147567 RepID=A0A9P4KI83_9PLEO|nr:GLE1-domain-containing protein [Didymosphaeria enalia]
MFPKSGASSSSMHTTASSLGSSWIDGSPSRRSPARNGVRTPGKDPALRSVDRSGERSRKPRRDTVDRDFYESPSRQLILEFSQLLIQSDRDFNERLDSAAAENAKIHHEQLNKAALEHERIREGAERERQRLILEQEQIRLKREEEQKRALERARQEKARQEAEIEQRQIEAKEREEEEARQRQERQRQLQEAEAREKARKEQEEAARKQRAEQEARRKAEEAAAVAEKARRQQTTQAAQPPPVKAPQPSVATPQPMIQQVSTASDLEVLHSKYLELHKRMKEFRKSLVAQHKKAGDPLKAFLGDTRRNMRLRMGQITIDRQDSKAAIGRIREILNSVQKVSGPTVDIRPYIISHPIPPLSNEAEAQYPALLLYAFICFEKFLIKQFEQEAANEDGRIIQELGLIAASLLADQNYMWKGIPVTDILLAKYHKACPILFGVSGDMRTPQGQARLGWMKTSGVDPTPNTYNQRMLGLGAGYAALSLRSFSASRPAIPMSEYWRAVSYICNTPPTRLYAGHFLVLKGLLRDYASKFINFYGAQARGVLRRATFDLPNRASPNIANAAALVKVLPDVWKNRDGLSLD